MVNGTMHTTEQMAAVGRLAARTGAWRAFWQWLSYRPERRYMRGRSAA